MKRATMLSVTLLLSLLLLAPLALGAQEKGVRFERSLSWQEVQAKARSANKHIMLMLCTARGRMCSAMDGDVFAQDSVAALVNDRFVAVKVQADTSGQDDAAVKQWYADAQAIVRENKITGLPVFLFYSPAGKIVHRGAGLRNLTGFLTLASEALDPAKQYYVQLDGYERGVKNYAAMMALARTARQANETDLARRIASQYIEHLSTNERYAKDNIRFMATFTERASDPGFDLFYSHADAVDKVVGTKGYAQSIADRVITADEINPLAFPGGKPSAAAPDWKAITGTINKKYGMTYADRTVLDAQIRWHESVKNWPEVTRYTLAKLAKYGSSLTSGEINGLAWDLFLHTDDTTALAKGAAIMEPVASEIERNPNAAGFMGAAYIDTYANLLHKMGRTAEAVTWEETAVRLTPEGSFFWDAHTGALAKMKKGVPTWPEK